jgi:hypothetical protein
MATQTLPAWQDVPQHVCRVVPHPAPDEGVLEPSMPSLEVVEPEPEPDVEAELEPEPESLVDPGGAPPSLGD